MPGMRKFYLTNFPDILKLADVSPTFKKKDKTFVENYRPVSDVSTVSKIFERVMQNHISDYLENFSFHFNVDLKKDSVQNMPHER